MKCCLCRASTNIPLERTDLPGSGWRCVSRKACAARVRDIVTAHVELATIMAPQA